MSNVSTTDIRVSISEAAALLGVSVRTVYRMQADGMLEPIYEGTPRAPKRCRSYRRADVEALIPAPLASSAR